MYEKLIIVGNLGKDPEMRYTPSGQPVTSFSVACNRQWTNQAGDQVKQTAWYRVTAWGRSAEVCNQYLKKGSKVLVEGKLTIDPKTGGPRIWTKQDGSAGASLEMNSELVRFLSSSGETTGETHSDASDGFAGAPEEDIPF
jgi:single-strand DNA-binding protein